MVYYKCKEVKNMKFKGLITFILLLAFMGLVLTVYANRTAKINSGEMTLVNQNQMDR
jgi:hypothetical protein